MDFGARRIFKSFIRIIIRTSVSVLIYYGIVAAKFPYCLCSRA